MHSRPFGPRGLPVSEIGIGTWQLGGTEWGDVSGGMTMAQFALRWCLDFAAVTTVIPGAKSPEQARANAAASNLPALDEAIHGRLRDFYGQEVAPLVRGPY